MKQTKQGTVEEIVLGVLVGVLRGSDDVEGRPAGQHLVEQHPQRPPVDTVEQVFD